MNKDEIMSDSGSGEKIEFYAAVYKVQTLVDNGIRVALDLPENATMQMAQLAECQRFGVVLDVVVTPESLTKPDNEAKKETEGKTNRVGRRRIGKRRNK